MQKFTYPQSDLDRAQPLLRVLGSFWANTYDARDQIKAFISAVAAGVQQNQADVLEAVDALSRHDIDVLHTENWLPITLKKSQINKTNANTYKFDDTGLLFSNLNPIAFDAFSPKDFYAFPNPKNFVTAAQLYDRVIFPTFSLIPGTDFIVDSLSDSLIFAENPFDIPGIATEQIYKDGEIIDEELTLWALKAKLDYQWLFVQFAYAINAQLTSTDNSKKLLNAIVDGLLAGGATEVVLDAALSAIFDIPLVETDNEIVELITLDNRGLIIATSTNVYRFAAEATPVVTVGQTLRAGDRLVAGFEITQFNRGEVPDSLGALALDTGYTTACLYGDLVFENRTVPLQVDENHPSGYTYVKFPLVGFPLDVQKFFDEMHARGIESLLAPVEPGCAPPKTRTGPLAHVLDRRKNPIGEPTADDLPATINPLKFIVENVLRNNAFVVTVRISALGKNQLGLYNIRHVRQLIPPYMALFFVYLLNGQTDNITPDLIADNPTTFTAAEPVADAVPVELVSDRGVTVRIVSGTCQ